MRAADFDQMLEELCGHLGPDSSLAILGFTATADRLLAALEGRHLIDRVEAIYGSGKQEKTYRHRGVPVRTIADLARTRPTVLVVADDARKEDLLWAAIPYVQGCPRVVIGGYGHFDFRDPLFEEERAKLEVPSLANGYPNSLVHLYQCVQNAARLRLRGVVAELGIFRGGTTMLLSRWIERLDVSWRIIGFDTFEGVPARRSPLDLYDHPDLGATNERSVRRYLAGRNVELVVGDIVETCERLRHEDLVLSFFDTDNYSPAKAALEIVRERTVVGGTIVFDHFTGVDRFKNTLGERMAAKVLLDDSRYFHLEGTGVFYRQR